MGLHGAVLAWLASIMAACQPQHTPARQPALHCAPAMTTTPRKWHAPLAWPQPLTIAHAPLACAGQHAGSRVLRRLQAQAAQASDPVPPHDAGPAGGGWAWLWLRMLRLVARCGGGRVLLRAQAVSFSLAMMGVLLLNMGPGGGVQ